MTTLFCLDCDHEINLSVRFKVGEKIKCPNCSVKLEIINVDPAQLDWVYEGPTIKLNWFDEVGGRTPLSINR
jgi:DNA-directed RNA polymerase subunit RPC12/RpoP